MVCHGKVSHADLATIFMLPQWHHCAIFAKLSRALSLSLSVYCTPCVHCLLAKFFLMPPLLSLHATRHGAKVPRPLEKKAEKITRNLYAPSRMQSQSPSQLSLAAQPASNVDTYSAAVAPCMAFNGSRLLILQVCVCVCV